MGTFTGYSVLSVALALPAEGRLLALDVSKDFTDRARGATTFLAEASA